MRYYREHPEEPIRHGWFDLGKHETAELRAKLADSFYAKSEPMPAICHGNNPAPSDEEEEQEDPEYNRDAWRRPDLT